MSLLEAARNLATAIRAEEPYFDLLGKLIAEVDATEDVMTPDEFRSQVDKVAATYSKEYWGQVDKLAYKVLCGLGYGYGQK